MPHRTTMTLDDDVGAKLEEEARRSGMTVREVINGALRRGLNPTRRPPGSKPFKVSGRLLKARPGVSFDNIEELLDQIEGPWRR